MDDVFTMLAGPPSARMRGTKRVGSVEHAVDVDLHHEVPALRCELPQRPGRLDSGVVEQQPDRAELVVRTCRQPLDGRRIRDIRGDCEHLGRAGQLPCHLLQALLGHVGQNESHAETRRVPGQPGADPTSGAGDDRCLPAEQLFLRPHVHPLLRSAGTTR